MKHISPVLRQSWSEIISFDVWELDFRTAALKEKAQKSMNITQLLKQFEGDPTFESPNIVLNPTIGRWA